MQDRRGRATVTGEAGLQAGAGDDPGARDSAVATNPVVPGRVIPEEVPPMTQTPPLGPLTAR